MRDEEAIRCYFGQPGFERFLQQLQRQYAASKDGVRGYVTLANVSESERRTLDGFYGIYSPPVSGETKRYSLKKFERLLLNSRFELTAAELLELLHGTPVLTRQEQLAKMHAEWTGCIQSALEEALAEDELDSRVRDWVQGLLEEQSSGSRTLRFIFARSPEEAQRCLRHCLKALSRIGAAAVNKPIRLPILAAQVTGDAHALDWKNPLGRLFWWGLASIHGEKQAVNLSEENDFDLSEFPEATNPQAYLIREGYRRGGIADDDISSQVMFYAPELFGVREERVLTLRQVERLPSERLEQLRNSCIYMVENPSVFAEIMDASAAKAAPLIVCGNGQPVTAALKLLDALLCREGVALYYAGDLDPAGLGIAQNLKLRYPQAFRAWCMNKELYLRYADKGIPLSDAERSRLQDCRYDPDAELAACMLDKGVKLHQELWVDELLQDLKTSEDTL